MIARGAAGFWFGGKRSLRPRNGCAERKVDMDEGVKFEARGNLEQALALYVRGRSWGNAARVALSLDRNFEAGNYCLRAGRAYDAAVCFLRAGALNECLDALLHVPATSPRFRSACLEAVRVSRLLCASVETLSPFLMPFLSSKPGSIAEAQVLNQLAAAFAKAGNVPLASAIYRNVLSAFPDDPVAGHGIAAGGGEVAERAEPTLKLPIPLAPGRAAQRPLAVRSPQWRARAWGQGAAPFSDRRTRIRERQFDTRELEPLPKAGAPAEQQTVEHPARATIELQQLPSVGSTFAGRFRIEALIGEGGSATVFRALDLELEEPIALKLFRPTVSAEADNLAVRFKLELSLSRHLAHPNIIRVFDLGSHAGWRYLTMELLEGSDLATRLAALGKPMPMVEGLRTLEQICCGLQVAHERGVIHRDIKPQNLFLTHDGVAKVMDFGIAKRLRGAGITAVGMIVGTPEYMSPEQATGFTTVTSATDLYALGATAYMMFTGAPPFTHREVVTLLLAHANELPPPPRRWNPAIDAELEAVILRLLEKDPKERFASARELGERLRGIRERLEAG